MKNKTLMIISAVAVLSVSGCATNDELFAKYDKHCDLPKAKVIEKIKVVEKEKIVTKEVVRGAQGMHWEPAVYFGFDQANLEGSETERLAKNVSILKKHPETKVSIQSFTDTKGSSSYNRKLAKKRESMVLHYLQRQGIGRDRVLVSALGEGLPILGDSVKDRQINRRVEMMLLDSSGRPMALKVKPEKSSFVAPYPVR